MMIPPRELAAQLAGSIFDHVERERTFVRHSIEEVLHDGLLLGQAKTAEAPAPMIGGAASQELRDAVIRMMDMIANDSQLYASMPAKIVAPVNEVCRALLRTGWQP
jgi:hypothetical protein